MKTPSENKNGTVPPERPVHSHKILHLVGGLGRGGLEKQVYLLGVSLRKRGWDQLVVSFDRDGVWRAPLLEAGIPVRTIERSWFKPKRLWQLRRLVCQEKPDLIISWIYYIAVYAHFLWGTVQPRKIFALRHDVTTQMNSGKTRRLGLERSAVESADVVLSNCRRNLDTLCERGVRLPAHEVIYNIVVPQNRARPAEPAAIPRMIAVGTLIPRKGYDILLRATGRLAAQGVKFELSIVGEGPQRAELQALAAQLGLTSRVKFLGDQADAPAMMAASHLLVHAARSEGLSNVILEAMAEGLPVVATRVSAAAEIIEDGVTGLLVEPENSDSLARAMRRLLGEPDLPRD